MNGATLAVVVALCGGAGAVLRYVVDWAFAGETPVTFPRGTFTVNLAGSLLLGLLAGLVEFHGAPPAWKTVVGTGFCGGLTTWSTASFETIRLTEEGAYRDAVAFGLGGLALSCLAAAVGLGLARI